MRAWLVVMAVLAGCGDVPSGSDGGGVDLAGLNDVDRCSLACAKMISCGVDYDPTSCNAGCLQSAVFLGCLRVSALDDCNVLAMCAFKQYGVAYCGGTSGVPVGSTSCNDAAMCEGTCNALS